ncbi:DUF1206 domain-containing protein [Plantibacter sp. PA-3-X8]|uniref:DUF1206 domain-containing protein n=1 Tax=unclassified Plantibacter TaxID=2624265 RepID=UPI000F6015E3|nr:MULTISPECIES: DUF1206 domain-containing protein [unclassified Plantibacter]AZH84030.1 DUF1206 domain-containing protein [Plantibacter sp. PA-3-X8]MBD8103186.1 DUF1206 domain-containing protein [Plantibacter sp. CFBP 8775]
MPENARAAADQAAGTAQNSTTLRTLARTGHAVNGLLHVLIGGIAISIALSGAGGGSGGGGDADQSGALKTLAGTPGGIVIIWVVAVGLFALGLWTAMSAFLVRESDTRKRWSKRISTAGRAIAYLAVGSTALTFALGGSQDSSQSSQGLTATLLSSPGGVFVVIVVGLVVIGIGGFFVFKGVTRKFLEDVHPPTGTTKRAVVVLGVVGWVAKGVALVTVGILFIVAAATQDPEKASGMDGAISALAALPFGVVILLVVGVGLIAYGLFCGARARWGSL